MFSSRYIREGVVELIELKLIRPPKFRFRTQPFGIEELMCSIREHGLLQPLIIRPSEGYFELIAGSRRLEALKKLRWRKAPCVVLDVDDKSAYEIALIENVQRETLDPIEEALAFKGYVDTYGWGSVSELAKKIGKSQEYVSQRLRLLKLPEDVKELIRKGRLTPSIGRELLQLPDDRDKVRIGKLAAERRYPVRKVKEIVEMMKGFESVQIKGVSPLKERYKLAEKAILVLRIALIKFDALIEEAEDKELREILFSKRLTLHSLLDEMIRYKLVIEKELRREGYV